MHRFLFHLFHLVISLVIKAVYLAFQFPYTPVALYAFHFLIRPFQRVIYTYKLFEMCMTMSVLRALLLIGIQPVEIWRSVTLKLRVCFQLYRFSIRQSTTSDLDLSVFDSQLLA